MRRMDNLTGRSPEEVFDDHLRLSGRRNVAEDLRRNYAEGCVMLTSRGVFHGHEGVWQLAALLDEELPNATFEFHTRLVEGRMALLVWSGRSEAGCVENGVDSFLIENGKIVVQTIHYVVTPAVSKL